MDFQVVYVIFAKRWQPGSGLLRILAKKEIQASLFSPVLSQAYPGLETIFYMGWEQYFIYGLEMRVHVCYEKYSPIEFFWAESPIEIEDFLKIAIISYALKLRGKNSLKMEEQSTTLYYYHNRNSQSKLKMNHPERLS